MKVLFCHSSGLISPALHVSTFLLFGNNKFRCTTEYDMSIRCPGPRTIMGLCIFFSSDPCFFVDGTLMVVLS